MRIFLQRSNHLAITSFCHSLKIATKVYIAIGSLYLDIADLSLISGITVEHDQTTIEGDGWDRVMGVVRACHEKAMELAPRCLTSITIDDRRGFTGRLEGKVKDVQDILAEREVRVE